MKTETGAEVTITLALFSAILISSLVLLVELNREPIYLSLFSNTEKKKGEKDKGCQFDSGVAIDEH